MSRAWLIKSEPESYAYEDLERDGRTAWDGVRNYQARNYMRDDMAVGDPVLVYHSNVPEPAVVGLARVASEAFPDPSQFDPDDPHVDPKATPDRPRWFCVEVEAVRAFARPVTLAQLKADPAVAGLALVRRGNRLSVMPVDGDVLRHILKLGGADGDLP